MATNWYATFDPLLSTADADRMVGLCERFGSYKMYSEEPTFEGIGSGLPARWDAARNFVRSGGRFGRSEPINVLAARTNYFRETYAYGAETRIDGIEPFLQHEGFMAAARQLYGRPLIEPAIVYANLLVPGQELAVHTDVPEFRGVNRMRHPQWLIVAMHHSGLFEDWRMPIATGVAWFHDCEGGDFAFYPSGPTDTPVAHTVRFNTAVLLDTDSVFHGVDRVGGAGGGRAPGASPADDAAAADDPAARARDGENGTAAIERLRPGMRLCYAGDRRWQIQDGDAVVARYRWEELRFSVSWKAYCFADEGERCAWLAHADDLSAAQVVDRLVADLRARGKLRDSRPPETELVDLLIDEYIRFPAPHAA